MKPKRVPRIFTIIESSDRGFRKGTQLQRPLFHQESYLMIGEPLVYQMKF